MYIMITDRCNMRCSHCCYSCTETGQDMTIETFVKACQLAESNGEMIVLGGGEPTLHPLFWQFFGIAMKYAALTGPQLYLVTNGTRTEDTVALAALAYKGVLGVSLSYGDYHDKSMVDERVIRAFNNIGLTLLDSREVNSVSIVSATGRAADWGLNYCACDSWVINPNGDVFPCGCRLQAIGNVNSKSVLHLNWEERRCARFGYAYLAERLIGLTE